MLRRRQGIKDKKFLFAIVVVLSMVGLVLSSCSIGEHPVEADELVIPSSLKPIEVFNETANAGPLIEPLLWFEMEWSAEYVPAHEMLQGATEEGFIEGDFTAISEPLYIKRDGKKAGDEFTNLILCIVILKYEDTESAERSFVNISETQELQDSIYGGIALKNGPYCLPSEWEEIKKYFFWDESTMPCYLVHTGCFVIHFYGRQDVINDMLDRIIVAFGVKE